VHGEGGKTPVWNQSFQIVIKGKTEGINIAVIDEDILFDDVLGETTIPIASLYSLNN
jgi:Ca2+-dependent lipid-binding protein